LKLIQRSFILLLISALFTGCGFGQQGNQNREPEIQKQTNRRNDNDIQGQNVNFNNSIHNQTRMEVADKAAYKVKNLKEVKQANVIVSNRNAFVAVVLDNQPKGAIRKELENKISDVVKSTDNNIRNVYVSANPDFVDRMTDYVDKIQQGKPIQGLFEEFTEMTQRIFPNAR
jgi:spore cortex protein